MYSRVVPRLHAGVRAEEMLRATTAIAEPRSGKHLSSLLVLHGLGDSADGFGDVVSILGSMFPDTKFVVPSAPAQPVTVNGGMVMPSWYDISSFDDRTTQECAGLLQSIESVRHLVEEECASVGDDKVAIMGFSQGGAVALHTGLTHNKPLAGLLILSSYLPRPDLLKVSEAAKEVPVRFHHGTMDAVVDVPWAEAAKKAIEEQGVTNTDFTPYPGMGHSLSQDELQNIVHFLRERL